MSDMSGSGRSSSELVLPPSTYAFVLDSTKGKVSVYVGPYKSSLSETDRLVDWDDVSQRFVTSRDLESAKQVWALAEEGQYIVLTNPAPSNAAASHPGKGNISEMVDLEVGRRVIVPGPATFPLWPGQTAKTIDGHHLRHNQYVIVRVYDVELAQQNWDRAVIAPQVQLPTGDTEGTKTEGSDDAGQNEGGDGVDVTSTDETPAIVRVTEEASQLTMGQLIVVPGTDVSFYMPSTGVEVVPEAGNQFVRDAVTLETLEYCILLDENGEKRYVRGPAVVFPRPTETFITSSGSRTFDAIELNEQSGLYVKVIEEYTEGDETFEVGQELFITGKEQAIYFPRAEHSIITYDNRRKHHAIAIPSGEGRYVLNRNTGQVDLVRGPRMFLPDPRNEVVVRRILDRHDVELMYPGNSEAIAVNQRYQEMSRGLTPGEHLESAEMLRASSEAETLQFRGSESYAGDTMQRGTVHTPPRTVTLDTKYEGAVSVSIWPGYAVLVTDKTGNRRVEVGPKVVLLSYDESIMALELSTGRPKNDRNLLRTGYLRVVNNVVSDIVTVETRDLVTIEVEISYRVNFEGNTPGAQQKWFDVENYVQVLTDHCRSRLRNTAKRYQIRDFYTNIIDIIRDTLLGEVPEGGERKGLAFAENGMRVYDVEILDVTIRDNVVADLLVDAQSKAIAGAIRLTVAEEEATREQRLEELKRSTLEVRQETAETEALIAMSKIELDLDRRLAEVASELQVAVENLKVEEQGLTVARKRTEQQIALDKKRDAMELERLTLETTEFMRRLEAVDDTLVAAMQSFADSAMVEKIITAVGPAALAAGLTTTDLLSQVFSGTPLEGIVDSLADRPFATGNNGRRSVSAGDLS